MSTSSAIVRNRVQASNSNFNLALQGSVQSMNNPVTPSRKTMHRLIKQKMMNKMAFASSSKANACNYMHYITDTIKDIEYHDAGKRQHYIGQACSFNTAS